ncbi:hypothetical protein BJY52DRAFT_1151944 [Lactarius psammicola]|nr:hypothetical protein BJY52DRAFT_1151944 [Lactarius psammicola]
MRDLLSAFVLARYYQPQTSEPDGFSDKQSPKSAYPSISMNQPCPVKGMYPLLDLITEQGSSGLVDKIIIAQESLQEFINALSPGAYSSITKVNFKILDNVVLKPFGIYGSKEEIVRFLREINAVDDNAYKLLTRENGHTTGSSEPVLRSGLYIVRSFLSTSNEQAYVVYWPEDTTWDDRAASPVQRNRVTFMRYLNKLCDQVVCLISSEHSRALVWGSDDNDKADEEGGDDDDDDDSTSTDSEKTDSDRVFSFQVAKTMDQEENVTVRAGFVVPFRYKINSPLLVNRAPPPDSGIDPGAICPTLLHGEKVQGFMTATFVPATRTKVMGPVAFTHDHQTADQIRLHGVALGLSENLEVMSRKALISALGLHTRFPKEHEAWESGETKIKRRFQQITFLRKAEIHAKIEQDFEGVRVQVQRAVVNELLKTFPSFGREYFLPESSSAEPTDPKDDYNNAENSLHDLFLLYPRTEQVFWGNIRGSDFGSCLKASEFQFKKKRMMFLHLLNSDSQYGKGLSADLAQSVADAVLSPWQPSKHLEGTKKASFLGCRILLGPHGVKSCGKAPADVHLRCPILSSFRSSRLLPSVIICMRLRLASRALPTLSSQSRSTPWCPESVCRSFQRKKTECDKQVQRKVDNDEAREVQVLWSKFVHQVKDMSSQLSTSKSPFPRSVLAQAGRVSYARADAYYVSGRRECLREEEIEYHIHLLRLRADEGQKVQLELDPSYVPIPILEERLTHSFRVSSSTVIKYAHLLEGGRILVGLIDPHGDIAIYVESLSHIDAAIQRRSFARLFHRDKIGETCLFALDESKRMLAVYSSARMQLHIFTIEDERGSLRGMGSAIDLLPFYSNGESIVHACFVHGREEILFVDSSAQARIFSLTMLQPKPASLQLPHMPSAIYSSPDGSCALVVQEKDGVSNVTAYHWTTFASTDGISITLPDFPVDLDAALLTSIVNRKNIHLIGLDATTGSCRSVILDITCKAAEFTFQEQRSKTSTNHGKETVHNCLIDCHSEVWTRFPVVAAMKRRTITSSALGERQQRMLTFITDDDQRPFSSYFSEMIHSFTKTSRKPTGNVLKGTSVSVRTLPSFAKQFLSSAKWPVSAFRAGEWLADLLCLIPIQIAITYENRFVPLKDGVLSTELEKSLLGADVNKIVDSLSVGWYESIFQSYWASKPVKVVSSMGEQSVGKSFTLNHLLDTSFAGSAMRTTEGVWLSVSPTDDALIVALDFEGVHSLERSAQEDTLLVLFNTALSNLVLFRNNFALSRDITGLFQPFQSSTSILDPASNPSLFRSTLLVIIKAGETRLTFWLKFQKIVEDEQDSNFITRLHAGKLNIVPWPVIESEEFYRLFRKVKKTLDQQQTSHHTAGEFLLTLKTLMAKLKANDWGAISHTMANHRADSLLAILPNALETGFSEIDPSPVPLKNFDTDVAIGGEDSEARFVITEPNSPDHEYPLTTLRDSWDLTTQRQYLNDSMWHSNLVQYLTHLVDLRVAHVKNWLESNVQRFEGGHASIEELRRIFDSAVIDLRASVELCRSQCGSCNLTCVRSSRSHKDNHDCSTNHRCIHSCSFCESDGLPTKPCGQAAGHPGDHICRVGVHLCGETCELSGSRACTETCVKPIQHDGSHLCSAPVHMCGQPCRLAGLRLPNGKSLTCSGTCYIPLKTEHTDHQCEDRECPASCQLCNQICSGGHLHGLKSGQNHLCGKEHPCSALCSAGICEIQTKPHAIEATFVGTHETFQYTRVSFFAKHLPCSEVINPGKVEHPGPHVHNGPFHYCDSRCESCGYLCTHPFGHPQQQHVTSHGSMSKTRWVVDDPDGTGLEIKGRKFSSNDDGAPMLCNLMCKSMGRHVHVDICRGSGSHNSNTQHITKRISPNPDQAKDWITHDLYWLRMGFEDPYSQEDQANFAKCDAMCPGPEHTIEGGGANAQPSGCTQPIFHAPLDSSPGPGYVSNDGHHFACKNPALLQPAFHVIFVIDKSGSMSWADRSPLPNAPGSHLIRSKANNRLGAVFSSLYSFWIARQATFDRNGQSGGGFRRDAYSLILFDSATTTCFENDFTSSPDELLSEVLKYEAGGDTDFTRALKGAQAVMTSHWSNERTPVVVFLSDGWCEISDECIYDICHTASSRRKPLSFHAVAFGESFMSSVFSYMARQITRFSSLIRMVEIAQEVQKTVPQNVLTVDIPSSFTKALDTVSLTTAFQGFAESLAKPRGNLLSSRFDGNNVGIGRLAENYGDTLEDDQARASTRVRDDVVVTYANMMLL